MIEESRVTRGETILSTHDPNVFKKHFSSAQIEIISADKVPPVAIDLFELCSKRFINPKDYKPGNFDAYFLIRHDSGEVTYAVQQTKTYWTGSTEILIDLIDLDQSGNQQGDGEIRYDPSDDRPCFKNKPFTGWTETEENYRKRGLGRRRLLMMNALSQMLYGLPLHSDTTILEQEKRILEKLLDEGKVSKYKEGEHDRYVFKDRACQTQSEI